jgi:hypothetical protein
MRTPLSGPVDSVPSRSDIYLTGYYWGCADSGIDLVETVTGPYDTGLADTVLTVAVRTCQDSYGPETLEADSAGSAAPPDTGLPRIDLMDTDLA